MAGRLKVILGYAAGVGKTYRMLEEGQALRAAGRDVVIGYFEPHGRAATIARTEGLEMVARARVEYRGRVFEEMDTEAILERRPAICLVDEFPHTNVPGSRREKRWEDVAALLEAEIDVFTTMNIQHLESLNDEVRAISGVRVRETVPDWMLKRAEEVVLVDLPPEALLNRLERGVVYAAEKARQARANFFQEPTLAALRELALRQTAHEVELRQTEGAAREPERGVRERLLLHVTEGPAAIGLLRRGRRVADYLRADCLAVAVVTGRASEALERNLDFARRLRIETRVLHAEDAAEALVAFARTNGITQIFLSQPEAGRAWWCTGRRALVMRVIRAARAIQVTVVAERGTKSGLVH